MKIVWLGGWGLSPNYLLCQIKKKWPNYKHYWITPTERFLFELHSYGYADFWIAYSLGSFLVMNHPNLWDRNWIFLAPILDIRLHAGLGGTIHNKKLVRLKTAIKKTPLSALKSFFHFSGMHQKNLCNLSFYSKQSLTWGLDQFQTGYLGHSLNSLKAKAWAGIQDPFIQPHILTQSLPFDIHWLSVGHSLTDLIQDVSF